MTEFVLDASAILAQLFDEPGGEAVAVTIDSSFVCAANYAEIISKLIDTGFDPADARETALQLRCEVIAVDQELATSAGVLRAKTRDRGVSLGDRFCLALAQEMGLPALTADRRWRDLDLGVEVQLTR